MVLGIATVIAAILVAAAAVPALAHQNDPVIFVPPQNVSPEVSTPAEGTTYRCFATPFSYGPGIGGSDNTCTPLQVGPPADLDCNHSVPFNLSGHRVQAFMCHPPDGSGQISGQHHEGH